MTHSSFRGGVDNQQYLALVIRERHLLALIVHHLEIINTLCRGDYRHQHESHHEEYLLCHTSLLCIVNNWGQSYEKSRAKQRNSFLFLPRRSKFAIFDGKVTKISVKRAQKKSLTSYLLPLTSNILSIIKFFCL